LRRIVLGIGCRPSVTEIAGSLNPGIAGRTPDEIERPADLREREYGAKKHRKDEDGDK
jgi:hypothetical protein